MTPKYPKYVVTRDGVERPIFKVWYQMGRGVYRVSWKDKDAHRGCLAVVLPDRFIFWEVEYQRGQVIDTVTPGGYTLHPQSLADSDDDVQDGTLTTARE